MNKVRTGEEALRVFDYLGIKEVSKEWQKNKGTHVYELPFKTMYNNGHVEINRFTIYKNGYVRKMVVYGENNATQSCYQLNKVRKVANFVKDYEWNDDIRKNEWNGKYRKVYNNERIMVDSHKQRLVYLCNYILKNYYNNKKYNLVGDYTRLRVSEVHGKFWRSQRNERDLPFEETVERDSWIDDNDVKVIINGHRYNLS